MRRRLVATVLGASAVALLVGACDLVRRADEQRPARQIDERAGRYAGVGLGLSEGEVRRVFGEPGGGDGYFPLGEEFRGPPSVPASGGRRPALLRYDEVAFLVDQASGVFSLMVTYEDAETRGGVGVGDPLERVGERYARVRCGETVSGEPVFGDEHPTYPWCRTRVGKIDVFFGDDPIESITLTRR